MALFKYIIRFLLPFYFYQALRSWAYHTFELRHFSYRDYQKVLGSKRHQLVEIDFKRAPFKIIDNQSFLFMHDEIFVKEIYNFHSNTEPFIIDCGANIGMSIIYFKEKFPKSKIIAFEPDPNVFKVLEANLRSFKIEGVELLNKAVAKQTGFLDFYSEGSDAGRIGEKIDNADRIKVETTVLSKFLYQEIDLLKIDIEGAETEVVQEISNKLHRVKRIFIEYHSFVGRESTLHTILGILEEHRFKVYLNSPGLTSNQPFIQTPSKLGMDMQLNVYGYKTDNYAP